MLFLLIPALRLAPALYDWAERMRIYRFYSELKRLEDEMILGAGIGSREEILRRLHQLNGQVSRLSVPTSFRPLVYSLRVHIDMVREELQRAADKPGS